MRDETSFAATYDRHRSAVIRYGLRRLGDGDAAEELAQEVFVVAWRRRDDVPDHALPWLYGVARRLLANTWRAAGRPLSSSRSRTNCPRGTGRTHGHG